MILEARDLCFAYRRDRPVLSEVSLTVAPGDRLAIVGPNGAGKSTLLRLLVGADRPASGSVLLEGRPLSRTPVRERARRLAYAAPRPVFGAPLSVRRVLELGRRPAGAASIAAVVDRLELGDLLDESVWTLSDGQRQRVSLGRAIAQLHGADRGALVVDEPTAAMDPRYAQLSLEALQEAAARGLAVIAVLHDLTAARRLATKALALDSSGRPASSGPAAEALAPERLREVYGIDFSQVEAPGGPALTVVPSERPREG